MSDLEEEAERLLDGMTLALAELERASVRAAEAETVYRINYAKAVLSSQKKTVVEREHEASIVCEKEIFEKAVATRLEKLAHEKIMTYKSSLEAIRTLIVQARSF